MPHVNKKPLPRSRNLVQTNKKLGLEWTLNGLGKPFSKNFKPKNRKKNSKHQGEIAACEQT